METVVKDQENIAAHASPAQLAKSNSGRSLQDDRPQSIIQKKQVEALANHYSDRKFMQMMMDQRPRSVSPLDQGGVIQRKVIFNNVTNQFSHDGKRPTWRKNLKNWTAMVYNLHKDLRGEAHLPNITGHTNIGNRNLARTHKIPFHQLQIFLERFCNGAETLANLTTFTNLVMKANTPGYAAMTAKVTALNNARAAFQGNQTLGNRNTLVRAANHLLGDLHNSVDNVLIGESGLNSAIAERGDWNVATTPGGTGVRTPISSEAQHTLAGTQYDPGLYVPAGQTTASSHITSRRPAAFHAHGHSVRFTTRIWRGPGIYQNGLVNMAGGLSPAGMYAHQP